MKTIAVNENLISVLMHPHEAFILERIVVMFNGYKGGTSVLCPSMPPLLASVNLRALGKKLTDQTPDYQFDHRLIWGSSDYEVMRPVPVEEYVAVELNVHEWAAGFYILVLSAYGCVIPENTLYCSTVCKRQEIKALIDSLQPEIEDHVYKVAAKMKSLQKNSNRRPE